MIEILENLFESKKIKEHGLTVGKKLGFMLSGGHTDIYGLVWLLWRQLMIFLIIMWDHWLWLCVSEAVHL